MSPEKATELRRPFPPESVGKLPKGGAMLDFVGHAAVTDRLLAVDPEWTWEPFALDDRGLPALDGSGNLWIRLTICGHTRIGVGDGKSAKEVIGDAIRNAAMRFGVALDLWAKEDLIEFAQVAAKHREFAEPSRTAEAPTAAPSGDQPLINPSGKLMKALQAGFNAAGVTDRAERLSMVTEIVGREVGSATELTDDEARRVLDHLPSHKGADQ